MIIREQRNLVLEEVFRTPAGCVYQSDAENCLYVDFDGKAVRFGIGCFFRFKRLVDKIDLAAMATDARRASDVEIISPCACDHCYVLTLGQLTALKELLTGAKVMMELNSIIQERVYRLA